VTRRLYRVLDYRYVYIMHLRRSRQYKIGIATNPEWRHEDIDTAVRGDVRLVMARKMPRARKIEKKLHRYFAEDRFTKRGAGSGKTEWFRLSLLDSWLAQFLVSWYQFWVYFSLVFWIVVGLIGMSILISEVYM